MFALHSNSFNWLFDTSTTCLLRIAFVIGPCFCSSSASFTSQFQKVSTGLQRYCLYYFLDVFQSLARIPDAWGLSTRSWSPQANLPTGFSQDTSNHTRLFFLTLRDLSKHAKSSALLSITPSKTSQTLHEGYRMGRLLTLSTHGRIEHSNCCLNIKWEGVASCS